MFKQDFTCPALLKTFKDFYPYRAITYCGSAFQLILVITKKYRPIPFSLATTNGVSVDVLSSSYLDVSVH